MDPIVLDSVWQQNKRYRVNWDWAYNKSAVSSLDYWDELEEYDA